jgi:hypothetical protein
VANEGEGDRLGEEVSRELDDCELAEPDPGHSCCIISPVTLHCYGQLTLTPFNMLSIALWIP